MLPHVTIKEIKQHRLLSSKTPESAIIKTLGRRRKFKYKRYITSDSIFTKCDNVEGLYKVSMKMEKRSVAVKRSTTSSNVIDDSCSRPAEKSEYCNYVMALLLELAGYSLSKFQLLRNKVPLMGHTWRNHAKSISNGNCCSKTTKF